MKPSLQNNMKTKKRNTRSKTRSTAKISRRDQNTSRYQWHYNVFKGYTPNERKHINATLRDNITNRKFKRGDLLMAKSAQDLNMMTPRIKYRHNKSPHDMLYLFTFLHHGQRKLFNTELYLLSKYLKSHTDRVNLVYAGAAAGVHFPYLSSLFPNVEFHLYDPAKFAIEESSRIHIYNEFFTDDVAASWAPGGTMHKKWGGCEFFLCDIRVDISDMSDKDREAQVTEDMERQQQWAEIIKPSIASMLKFRPPYDSGSTLEYLPGYILWQTWPGKSSGETRLITEGLHFKKANNRTKYKVSHYEDIAAAHNTIDRTYARYNDIPLFNLIPGYDGCWDCRAEAETWKMYLDITDGLTSSPRNIANKMNKLTYSLKQPLNVPNSYHGRYGNFISGNKWLWMITRSLQKINRKKVGNQRHTHEINRVKGLGVKGYLKPKT